MQIKTLKKAIQYLQYILSSIAVVSILYWCYLLAEKVLYGN